ncbi:16S rRNA (cytosine(1402)-N(4))-methyltransferase RsmH [Pelagibacteraceae bacterium]|nr:16S rRNA (cytosine(1402)-N(4))-methyltransferase RsmH [Pelagibacteraceae bacterium]
MIEKTGHVPVLLNEVMNVLEPKPMKTYIDATFGNGGYSRKILETSDCNVIAIDRDPMVINQANKFKDEYQERFEFFNYKFSQLDNLLESLSTKNIDGFVFDLGVSSMQIDNQDRGFSFQNDGKLDMRMSQNGLTAEEIINEYSETDLADIIFQYGDERKSRKIAKKIVSERINKRITSTIELAKIVSSCFVKKYYKSHPATKTFQAIRIFVNKEIEELIDGLNTATKFLAENGKLCIVTFHSIEDRIVKNFFKITGSKNYISNENKENLLFNLKNKPIKPSDKEISNNRRSRSAKLRFGIRNFNNSKLISPNELGFV